MAKDTDMIRVPYFSQRTSRALGLCLGGFLVFGSVPVAAQTSFAATLDLDLGGGQRLEVRLVHAGTFAQGSPVSEANRNDEEYPRTVSLTMDYYLGTTEVTVGQFTRFADSTSYRTEAEKGESGGFGWDGTQLVQRRGFNWRNPGFPQSGQHPVALVTYADALAFCSWLQARSGRTVDLPTEAQWEYAARAGETTPWPGADSADAVAWHKANSPGGTHPVRSLQPNAWGFYDLGGNVAEWCRDWYLPYTPAPQINPSAEQAPGADKARRVLRGGSWIRDAKHARVAARYRNDPKSRNADNGFRVLVSVATLPRNSAVPAAIPAPSPNAQPPPTAVPTPTSATAPPRSPAVRALPGVTPTPRSGQSVETGGWGTKLLAILCPFSCLGAVVAGTLLLIRRNRTLRVPVPSKPPADSFAGLQGQKMDPWIPARILPASEIRTELGSDGFRLFLRSVAAGELVRYSVRVGEQLLSDTIPYSPSDVGQFIYTGAPPTDVTIHGIAAGSENELPGQTTIHDSGPGGGPLAGPWSSSLGEVPGLGQAGHLGHRPRARPTPSNPAAY